MKVIYLSDTHNGVFAKFGITDCYLILGLIHQVRSSDELILILIHTYIKRRV